MLGWGWVDGRGRGEGFRRGVVVGVGVGTGIGAAETNRARRETDGRTEACVLVIIYLLYLPYLLDFLHFFLDLIISHFTPRRLSGPVRANNNNMPTRTRLSVCRFRTDNDLELSIISIIICLDMSQYVCPSLPT
jgi:hypothetical protein